MRMPMRWAPILSLAALTIAAGGCSSEADLDEQRLAAWEPPIDGTTRVDCAGLYEGWVGEERPFACWTFIEFDRLEDAFAAVESDLSGLVGAEPARGPACMGGQDGRRVVHCQARWRSDDQTFIAVVAISFSGIEQLVDMGLSLSADVGVLHEVILWVKDGDQLDDDEWEVLFGTEGT